MSKITLMLDSQQITSYQKCARRFHYGYKYNGIGLRPRIQLKHFDKGTFVHDIMESVNKSIMDGNENVAEMVVKGINDAKENKDITLDNDTEMFIMSRILRYFGHWKLNPGKQVVAAEKGFSKVLFEDDHYCFIYEGRIDATLFDTVTGTYFWRDYKTQSSAYDIYPFNNQALGYSWALEREGEYDFIGLQKKVNEKTFHRQRIKFTQDQINSWVHDTILTYFEIVKDVTFKRERAACEGKFGKCTYVKLCEKPASLTEHLVKIHFKEKEEVWSAWKNEE